MLEEGLPSPGAVISEYTIVKPIGVGGCGAVFQAYQERLDRDVAVKVLLPSAAQKVTGLAQRFLREIDIVKRLEHPNIVRLYDFGQSDVGLLWMAMELVRGPELATILHDEVRLSPVRARAIILQALSALAEAHNMAIVHRDLKPGNIMLTRKGADNDVVKLLDFGIGKALGEQENAALQDLTGTHGDSFGTPRYMAPELLLKEDIGPHSDVYSMGLILFESVVGEAAVVGDTIYEILARQLSSALDLPEWLRDTDLGRIIIKATAKDWKERYPSALDFHKALSQCDVSDVIPDGPPTRANDTPQPGALANHPATPLPLSGGDTGRVPQNISPTSGPVDAQAVFAVSQPTSAPVSVPIPAQVVAPTVSQPDMTPTPGSSTIFDELEYIKGGRAARQKKMVLTAVLIAFAVVMVILIVALAGGEDESAPDESTEVTPDPKPEPPPVDPDSLRFQPVPWNFKTTPPGAKVTVDGRRLCEATPCTADLDARKMYVTVYFALDGYRDMSKSVVPDKGGDLEVELQPIAIEPPPGEETPDPEPKKKNGKKGKKDKGK